MTTSTIVVHGATGTQGAPIVRRLVADGHSVRAAVRNPDPAALPRGVQPVTTDLLDVDSLVRAYEGADAVVVALPLVFAPERAVPQARAVLDALGKAGVPRAVFNTGGPLLPEPIGVPYLDARAILAARLRDVVAHGTVVGPVAGYMENFSAAWSAPRVLGGELVYPLPEELPIPWVALDDLAAEIADALTGDGPAVRVVAGPEVLTGDRVAATLSQVVGREVRWRTIPSTAYADMMRPTIGAEAAAGISSFYAPPPPGAPALPAPDPGLVRSGRTTLAEWARRQPEFRP